MDKYSVDPHVSISSAYGVGVVDEKAHKIICICTGPEGKTNAEKIKNLLNETSRSQGVYPK